MRCGIIWFWYGKHYMRKLDKPDWKTQLELLKQLYGTEKKSDLREEDRQKSNGNSQDPAQDRVRSADS